VIDRDHLRRRIALLVPRLGSSFDGEATATVRAIERTLTAAGCDWHWLADVIREPAKLAALPSKRSRQNSAGPGAQPMNDWRSVVRFCQLYGVEALSEKDIDFIDSLSRLRPQHLSPRQQQWLDGIASRLGMRRSA